MDYSDVSSLRFHLAKTLDTLEVKSEAKRKEIDDLNYRLMQLDDVNIYFQKNITYLTEGTRSFVETLVNRGLTFIFGEGVSVSIVDKVQSNKTLYSLRVVDARTGAEGLTDSHGGGVMAVVSFLFRFLVSVKTQRAPVLVLDESFTFVSREYHERLSEFLRMISDEYGYDILLVSHQPALKEFANKVYTLDRDGI